MGSLIAAVHSPSSTVLGVRDAPWLVREALEAWLPDPMESGQPGLFMTFVGRTKSVLCVPELRSQGLRLASAHFEHDYNQHLRSFGSTLRPRSGLGE
jgi:hypothetical protein